MPLRYLTAGESHGSGLSVILEGFPAGLKISTAMIEAQLLRRRIGYGAGPRMKIESDRVRILSGVLSGTSTGGPLAILIENEDHLKWIDREITPFTVPRPGHADLAAAVKYGYPDLRYSLERASARETAVRVAVGTVCRQLLAVFGIEIGGYVRSIGDVTANTDGLELGERARLAEENDVRVPDPEAASAIRGRIEEVMHEGDTLGGTLEIFALGLPPGLGSHVHWDRRLDARLGAAVLSVPAVKGVEIGPAFDNSRLRGSEAQDAIHLEGERLVRATNRAGGMEGGITNGEPILLRAAMKPIATTLRPQQSVDLTTGEAVATRYERSDFCPVPRAVPILEAVVACTLADAMLEKLGGDSMEEIIPRFKGLRRARLSDLSVDGVPRRLWDTNGESQHA